MRYLIPLLFIGCTNPVVENVPAYCTGPYEGQQDVPACFDDSTPDCGEGWTARCVMNEYVICFNERNIATNREPLCLREVK